MGNKEGFSGFGTPERKIRKMQDQVKKDVDERIEGVDRAKEERKKEREFSEASKHAGMDKGDLTRSNRAKR